MRKFEKINYEQFEKDFIEYNSRDLYEKIVLPNRHTKASAGYDFYSLIDFTLNPGEIIKIPTGVKVTMENDEFLMLAVRSSIGFKYNVRMCNQVGIVDADYYNNETNNGHMWFAFQNHGIKPWIVKAGDRIGQGIFIKYLLTDDDNGGIETRTSGSGTADIGSEKHE
jgi:dUTP pyrophosphatase